jgi:C1A family cysteine protease
MPRHVVKNHPYRTYSHRLVRNSWSTNWGEDGYIRLQLDANTCGLANEATIPTIAA